MRTIFITSFHAHISRNIFTTPVLKILKAAPDLRLVLVVPDFKVEYFREKFGDANVLVEGMKLYQASRTFRGLLFKRISRTLFDTGTTCNKRKYKYYWDRKFFYFINSTALGSLGRFQALQQLGRYLDMRFSPADMFLPLFEKYKPNAVFSTDIHNENDVALMQDARRFGVPVLGMWRSWDNPTQQMLRVLPDKLFCGSRALKEETRELHRYPEEKIVLTGHPHYDRYLLGPVHSREEFFSRWGLDPKKRLILYAAGGDKIIKRNDVDQYVMEILGTLDMNVIVRYPPGEDVTLLNFKTPANMAIDKPGFRFAARPGEFEITKEDDDNLIDELSFADVVISGPTSILIDGAFMDKPVIAVNFYPTPRRNRYEKGWGYLLEHIHKLFQTGGVWHVESREEFLNAIQTYFQNPTLHREGREKIRNYWFSHADGSASMRLAGEILDFVASENH